MSAHATRSAALGTGSEDTSAARHHPRYALDARGWACVRILLAVWLFIEGLRVATLWPTLYGPNAVIAPRSVLLLSAPSGGEGMFPHAIPTPHVGWLLGAVGDVGATLLGAVWLLSALGLGVGFARRGVTVILALALAAVATRQPMLAEGVDGWVVWFLVLSLWLPLDTRWAAVRGTVDPRAPGVRGATIALVLAVGVGAIWEGGAVLWAAWTGWHAPDGAAASRSVWALAMHLLVGASLILGGGLWLWNGRRRWTRGRGAAVLAAAAVVWAFVHGSLSWCGVVLAVLAGGSSSSVLRWLERRWVRDDVPPSDVAATSPGWFATSTHGLWAVTLVGVLVVSGWHAVRWGDAPSLTVAPGETWRGQFTRRWLVDGPYRWIRGLWAHPRWAAEASRRAPCATALGRLEDGSAIDLFARTPWSGDVEGPGACATWHIEDPLARLRRHPWAQRAVLTDVARWAWSAEATARFGPVGAVRVVSWRPDAPPDAPEVRWVVEVPRPPARSIVGTFR